MKLLRSCLLFVGCSISLIGVFGGCGGGGGPEALPKSPVVESGEKVIVEGVDPKPKGKGLTESPVGPKAHP